MHVRRTATTTAALAAMALSAGLLLPGTAMADATPVTPTPPTATAPSTPAPADDCDRLPAGVQGMPSGLTAGSAGGDYIWHDKTGWHLRVTHVKNDKRVYSGVIHTTKAMAKEPVALEKADSIKLSADRKTLTFRFTNYGFIDGVDFVTDCSQAVSFKLWAGGNRISPSHVYLGATKHHPSHVPFTIRRHDPAVTPTPTPTPVPTPTAVTPAA